MKPSADDLIVALAVEMNPKAVAALVTEARIVVSMAAIITGVSREESVQVRRIARAVVALADENERLIESAKAYVMELRKLRAERDEAVVLLRDYSPLAAGACSGSECSPLCWPHRLRALLARIERKATP